MAEAASLEIVALLTDEQRAVLEVLGTVVSYGADRVIYQEGQPSRSVLIVREGHVKVTQRDSDGTEVILAIRGIDEILGDEGVLMDEPRSATITTITDVVGLDIAAADLLSFVEDNRLWPMMYRAAVRRRRQLDRRVLVGRLDVRTRLARALLELAAEVGEGRGADVVIVSTLSQRDLATRIGASRDAVAIELRKLREEGVVSTGRGRFVLHDPEALRRISSG